MKNKTHKEFSISMRQMSNKQLFDVYKNYDDHLSSRIKHKAKMRLINRGVAEENFHSYKTIENPSFKHKLLKMIT